MHGGRRRQRLPADGAGHVGVGGRGRGEPVGVQAAPRGERRVRLLPLQLDGGVRRVLHPSRRRAVPGEGGRLGWCRLAHQRHQGTVPCVNFVLFRLPYVANVRFQPFSSGIHLHEDVAISNFFLFSLVIMYRSFLTRAGRGVVSWAAGTRARFGALFCCLRGRWPKLEHHRDERKGVPLMVGPLLTSTSVPRRMLGGLYSLQPGSGQKEVQQYPKIRKKRFFGGDGRGTYCC